MTDRAAVPSDPTTPAHEQQLGQALGEVLVKLGVVEDWPLTGPQLLVAAKDFVERGEVRVPSVEQIEAGAWVLFRYATSADYANAHPSPPDRYITLARRALVAACSVRGSTTESEK